MLMGNKNVPLLLSVHLPMMAASQISVSSILKTQPKQLAKSNLLPALNPKVVFKPDAKMELVLKLPRMLLAVIVSLVSLELVKSLLETAPMFLLTVLTQPTGAKESMPPPSVTQSNVILCLSPNLANLVPSIVLPSLDLNSKMEPVIPSPAKMTTLLKELDNVFWMKQVASTLQPSLLV